MNIARTFIFISILTVPILVGSCGDGGGVRNLIPASGSGKSLAEGASGNIMKYEKSAVNAVEQARPTIMVLPGDHLLKQSGALSVQKVGGREVNVRDYNKFLLANSDNSAVISFIQDAFVQANYPVQDLGQTLKQLETQSALDMVDGLDKDAKTLLLAVAQPDMIIELELTSDFSPSKPMGSKKNYDYIMRVIDAYTNDVVSSVAGNNLSGSDAVDAVGESVSSSVKKTLKDVQRHFSDILTRGRNVTVRIAVRQGSGISLSDELAVGETYSDWIIDYIKTRTVKGAYKMQYNTSKEMYFVNVRIPLLNSDGTQYGVYDWARDMGNSMSRNLGLRVSNKSQGLGQILISIDGIR